MRIASLVPAGTEIVAALGAEHELVGISHECDFPPRLTHLPRLTWSPIDVAGSSGAIDAQVRSLTALAKPVIVVDSEALKQAGPDVIITQDLCEVCAVTDGDLRSIADVMTPSPELVPLRARDLAGIFADIRQVGVRLDRVAQADLLVADLETRLLRVRQAAGREAKRVVCLEWLEPLFIAGHWVPDLVAAAGAMDVGAVSGTHSAHASWDQVTALAPDVVFVMLCGFGVERAATEWSALLTGRPDVSRRVDELGCAIWAIDGNAYTSRPGPRVVDGAALLASALKGVSITGLIRLH